MSPIKAEWLTDESQRGMVGRTFDRGRCRDLVHKMAMGQEAFVAGDKPVYEWLMGNMHIIFKGTIYEKLVPAFQAILTNAWEGNEKVFFDLELLDKLDIALSVYLTLPEFGSRAHTFHLAAFGQTFAVDKRG